MGGLFATPMSIARSVIHKFVSYLEREATERIWKPRCKSTIEYEKSLGINAKSKKAPYRGPRVNRNFGYGYIFEDGTCPCGEAVDEHTEGLCPGVQLDPHEADRSLLRSLQGLRRLELMEGIGRIPFL